MAECAHDKGTKTEKTQYQIGPELVTFREVVCKKCDKPLSRKVIKRERNTN